MARKNPKSKDNSWQSKIEYLRFSYNEEVEILGWLKTAKLDPLSALDVLLDAEWSVKFTKHKNGKDVVCTATCRDEALDIVGRSYVIQYPNYSVCLLVCYWVCFVYLDDERSDGRDSSKGSTVFDELLNT